MKKKILMVIFIISIFISTGCELDNPEDLALTDEQKVINKEHIEYLYNHYRVSKVRFSKLDLVEENCECKLYYKGECEAKSCEVSPNKFIWIYTICYENNSSRCIRVKYDDSDERWKAVAIDGAREFDNLEKKEDNINNV